MSDKHIEQVKWVQDTNVPFRPPIDEFPVVGQTSFKIAVLDKLTGNIFVPLGLVATVACLTMGLVNMKRGDVHRQQIFMRGRVGFQCFTLAAMTLGMYLTSRKKALKRKNER